MTATAWRRRRDDRTLRYSGRTLDSDRWIHLKLEDRYAERYDGQVAIITAATLLGRMTPSIALDIPPVPIVQPLPFAGTDLAEFVLSSLFAGDPHADFSRRPRLEDDYAIQLGPEGAATICHGSGWNAYVGPPPAPAPPSKLEDANPIGPALAAISAVAEAFRTDLQGQPTRTALESLSWSSELIQEQDACLLLDPDLGRLWVIGTGSVGTAALFFLGLATRTFQPTLFDGDVVRIENLDRSPIFIDTDVGKNKAEVAAGYLARVGCVDPRYDPHWLDESSTWKGRQAGDPDLIVSAANERNVRAVIEHGSPPIQVYGTTGKNWQASVMRHIPGRDPCSCCVFPPTETRRTECAGEVPTEPSEERVDAALPYLSFAAGLMTAAEILKLGLPGYPFSGNRVVLNTCPSPSLTSASLRRRAGCICSGRSESVHQKMLAETRYDSLSGWHHRS